MAWIGSLEPCFGPWMLFQVTMAYPFSAGVNVSSNRRQRLDPILLEFQYKVIRIETCAVG